MPAIARVVGQDKEDGQLKVTVRVTGMGDPKSGAMPKRAKLRALIASGMVPDNLTGERRTDREGEFNDDEYTGEFVDEINMSLDPEVAEGDIDDVKNALDVIKEFGTFAQLEEIKEMDTQKIVGLTPIKNVFGRGFADIVNTAEYTYIITTKYSF